MSIKQFSAILILLIGISSCNSRSRNTASRIIGGNHINGKEHPWIASIQATNFQKGWHLCGGALLSPQWVVTAAHCLDHEKPEWLWVVLGAKNLELPENSQQHIHVASFIKHHGYDYSRKPQPNDVALVKLKTPAKIGDLVRPLDLPGPGEQFQGKCTELGWGAKTSQGGMSPILKSTTVPLLEQAECRSRYPMTSTDRTLCAGYLPGGIGACEGDNGGPVLCQNKNGAMTAAGIISYRQGCALEGFPAVYTSLTYFRDWITSVIKN